MASASASQDVTTYHDDRAPTGLFDHETTLTPANVDAAHFGLVPVMRVDGKVAPSRSISRM